MNESIKSVKPGAGPRHIVIHPNKKFAYLISEIISIVTVFYLSEGIVSGSDGQTSVQTVSTIPDGWTGVSTCSQILVSPDGKFVYGSNRGHDSIVVYAINQDDGTLTLVEHTSVEGEIPRNFAISPDGEFILVACQNTHTVGSFKIDKTTGKLTSTGKKINIGSPNCVCFQNSL